MSNNVKAHTFRYKAWPEITGCSGQKHLDSWIHGWFHQSLYWEMILKMSGMSTSQYGIHRSQRDTHPKITSLLMFIRIIFPIETMFANLGRLGVLVKCRQGADVVPEPTGKVTTSMGVLVISESNKGSLEGPSLSQSRQPFFHGSKMIHHEINTRIYTPKTKLNCSPKKKEHLPMSCKLYFSGCKTDKGCMYETGNSNPAFTTHFRA